MKFLSWNVNGIRAVERKHALDWIWTRDYDVIALQETKSHPDQLPHNLLCPPGYYSFFNSAIIKKGYSGVVLYVKQKPKEVIYGLDDLELDSQGRLITLVYKDYIICNGYFPNGGSATSNLEYKLRFFDSFLDFINRFKNKGYNVIFGGDINVAHCEIDLARPKANIKNTGFLPTEREWIDKVIKSGYVDVYRTLNPNKFDAYTYWDQKSHARVRNVGWRIDYWFVSNNLLDNVEYVTIMDEVLGSDHCPLEMSVTV